MGTNGDIFVVVGLAMLFGIVLATVAGIVLCWILAHFGLGVFSYWNGLLIGIVLLILKGVFSSSVTVNR